MLMYCLKCGREIPDNAKFCTHCGAVTANAQTSNSPYPRGQEPKGQTPNDPYPNGQYLNDPYSQNQPPYDPYQDPYPPYDEQPPVSGYTEPPMPPKKKKSNGLTVALICIAVFLIAGLTAVGVLVYKEMSGGKNDTSDSDSDKKDDKDKDKDSKDDKDDEDSEEEEEETIDYSLDLSEAEALLTSCSYADALELLESMEIDESHADYEYFSSMMLAATAAPEIDSVDSDTYPSMTVRLNHEDLQDYELTTENVLLLENDTEITSYEVSTDADGNTLITYTTDSTESGEDVTVNVEITFGTITIPLSTTFTVPTLDPANIEFVSADVSEYPVVKIYLRVTDPNTDEAIENLLMESFVVEERLEGGEYLSREVNNAFSLEGNAGLNTALVADKSDSISDYDMDKIKSVMTEFVNSMDFDAGDQAMVIAFDSIVQTMCTFTNDQDRLNHGIENMSTDGRTACYDAIYNAVQNASFKGGARCVIAFTDGYDNESIHTPEEVIYYANTMQVPLYIIGVGDQFDTYELQNMASSTNGRYWDIDDLYDLEEIFNAIYVEQKDLYVIEYESDTDADADAPRDIIVEMNGSGYTADLSTSFTPIISADSSHTSRYEIFTADVSWEEANALCIQNGGHLATITDSAEEQELIEMAEAAGLDYIWLGGYTSYDSYNNVFAHWITGEEFNYQNWADGEPSRQDLDGTPEWYLMLWNIESLGGWTWNDQRNDPVSEVSYMSGKIGYICEYE